MHVCFYKSIQSSNFPALVAPPPAAPQQLLRKRKLLTWTPSPIMALGDSTCPICLQTMFPVEKVSISYCMHYCHLECWNAASMARGLRSIQCCICRRHEPSEEDVLNILIISNDIRYRHAPNLPETREQFNLLGQNVLKLFEDGRLSRTELAVWAWDYGPWGDLWQWLWGSSVKSISCMCVHNVCM